MTPLPIKATNKRQRELKALGYTVMTEAGDYIAFDPQGYDFKPVMTSETAWLLCDLDSKGIDTVTPLQFKNSSIT
jgi:hypothetical protein